MFDRFSFESRGLKRHGVYVRVRFRLELQGTAATGYKWVRVDADGGEGDGRLATVPERGVPRVSRDRSENTLSSGSSASSGGLTRRQLWGWGWNEVMCSAMICNVHDIVLIDYLAAVVCAVRSTRSGSQGQCDCRSSHSHFRHGRTGGQSCHAVSCRVVSCRVVSCRVVSCRVVSCRVVSCLVVSHRVASRFVAAHHPNAVSTSAVSLLRHRSCV